MGNADRCRRAIAQNQSACLGRVLIGERHADHVSECIVSAGGDTKPTPAHLQVRIVDLLAQSVPIVGIGLAQPLQERLDRDAASRVRRRAGEERDATLLPERLDDGGEQERVVHPAAQLGTRALDPRDEGLLEPVAEVVLNHARHERKGRDDLIYAVMLHQSDDVLHDWLVDDRHYRLGA